MTALHDVLWIGGGSGAGKSTIARRIGAAHGLPVVHTDDSIGAHAAASAAQPLPSSLFASFRFVIVTTLRTDGRPFFNAAAAFEAVADAAM